MGKIIAYCTNCGMSQGIFNNEEELRLKIAKLKKCENCNSGFGFLSNGRIWNLQWETTSRNEVKEYNTHAFWNIIHKNIVEIAMKKFEDGHYADAVESAFKEINKRVKEVVKGKIGAELDGSKLMHKALSVKRPIIILSDHSTETGRNIQEGYMHIFAGAMIGIRNPKAHDNITITKERAIHFIFLASLLMQKLDEAL